MPDTFDDMQNDLHDEILKLRSTVQRLSGIYNNQIPITIADDAEFTEYDFDQISQRINRRIEMQHKYTYGRSAIDPDWKVGFYHEFDQVRDIPLAPGYFASFKSPLPCPKCGNPETLLLLKGTSYIDSEIFGECPSCNARLEGRIEERKDGSRFAQWRILAPGNWADAPSYSDPDIEIDLREGVSFGYD